MIISKTIIYPLYNIMIFTKPLYDTIFTILSQEKGHSIQSLQKAVNKEEKISLPNFYKIIDQLLEKQILTKEKGEIRLHSAWIISFLELAENIKQHYLNDNTIAIDLKEGEQKIFYASWLIDLDNIRANILSNLGNIHGKNESSYIYNSHPSHILGMQETESVNFKNLWKQTQKIYFLIGNESPLDLYGADLLRMQWPEVLCNNKTKFLKEGYFVNIIGDYILEVMTPQILTQYFKTFFDNTKKIKDFTPELFQQIFKMKANCKLTFRRNKKDAEMFKKEIKKYFT